MSNPYDPYGQQQPPYGNTQPGGAPYEQQPYYHHQPPPQPAYMPMPVMPVAMVPALPTDGLATASMVLGIVGIVGGWCLFGIPCILAVIFGHVSLQRIANANGALGGRGMAIAGLAMGYVFVVPAVLLTFLFFVGAASGSA